MEDYGLFGSPAHFITISASASWIVLLSKDKRGDEEAEHLLHRLPFISAVVAWTTSSDMHEAAIRFEPDAWRPARVDPEQGVARTEAQSVTLHNPLDYYRHLALSTFLDDYDGAEFLMSQGTLFHIDAAAIGWHLFDVFLLQVVKPEDAAAPRLPSASPRSSRLPRREFVKPRL